MRTVLLLLLLCLPIKGSSADITGRVVLYAGHALDLHSTEYALKVGNAAEANAFGQTFKERLALTVFSAALLDIVSTIAGSHGHPRLAKWFRITNGSVRAGVAVHNYQVGRHERRFWNLP